MRTEAQLLAIIRRKLGSLPNVRIFRNNNGVAVDTTSGVPRVTRYGLMPGSGDLIGWRTYTVRPEDVGRKIAVFVSVEVKRPGVGVVSKAQRTWAEAVRKFGGIASIATTEDCALRDVETWEPEAKP